MTYQENQYHHQDLIPNFYTAILFQRKETGCRIFSRNTYKYFKNRNNTDLPLVLNKQN